MRTPVEGRTNVRPAVAAGLAVAALMAMALPAAAQYSATNLVANRAGFGAAAIDPNLINPWGISASGGSPWWVSDNGMGLSTLYNGAGVPQALVVTIPPAAGAPPGTISTPTGQVSTAGTPAGDFILSNGSKAAFIFVTEDGTVNGWNGAAGTTAIRAADNSAAGAVYKGVAIGNNGAGSFLYAANFAQNKIDVFNSSFGSATLAGNFTDPTAPAGYAPFNIQNVGGQLYVAYAPHDPGSPDEIPAPGNGIVDVFDLNGNFVKRLATGTPGGPLSALNDPWGFAMAPSNFGPLSGALLVGQFGNGQILAFNPTTNAFLGALSGLDGVTPIVIDGLWGIGFGNGGNAGATNSLYYAAGPNGEADGIFGRIVLAAPEPGSLSLLGVALLGGIAALRRRRPRA